MPPSRRQPPVRRRPKVAGAGIRRPSPGPRAQDEDRRLDSEEPRGRHAAAEVPEEDVEPVSDAGEQAAPVADGGDAGEDTPPEPEPRKPAPRPKPRDAGAPKPQSYAEAEAAAADEPDEPSSAAGAEAADAEPRRKLSPFVLAGALFGLALVLAGFAVWFKIEANHAEELTANEALLDTARTAEVSQAGSKAAETLFSYDFNDIAKTQDAAQNLLLNDEVRARYTSLMGEVERLAPEQRIVVTVKATRSAVVMLEGDRARVMVFVDQTATRTDQNQTSSGSAQLWLNLQNVDGQWKVSDLNTYNSEQPTPAPADDPQAPQGPPAPPG